MLTRKQIMRELAQYEGPPITLMEVCGSHAAGVMQHGIRSLLGPGIQLVSGPGCPVCVTGSSYIDRLCDYALEKNCCVMTFGDMLKVPGTKGSLSDQKGKGGTVRMVYSPLEVIGLAKEQPWQQFVVAAVGFETTAPLYGLLLDELQHNGIQNVKLLTALKLMPPVLKVLCQEEHKIDGFIAPGHVAAITGTAYFEEICRAIGKPFAISGFEGEEILLGIYDLVRQTGKGTGEVHNLYPRIVKREGNIKAQQKVARYFEKGAAYWRGMGVIQESGLYLKQAYSLWDGGSFLVDEEKEGKVSFCRCGEVIRGQVVPRSCKLFGKSCTPMNPKGPCMVSSEGVCGIWYRGGEIG